MYNGANSDPRGIETEIQGNLCSNLTASVGYAFNITRITKSLKPEEVGKISENAPRHSSTSWFKYLLKKVLLTISLWLWVIHRQAKDTHLSMGISLPAYCVFNSAIYYNYKHFGFGANINNISNKSTGYRLIIIKTNGPAHHET